MKNFLIKTISFYQKHLSLLKKPTCVFFPSCSEYTKEALTKYGFFKGLKLGIFRIFRCHPWQKKHFDPLL
jgi:putative membrane protein insertion efficiency factor